MNKQQLEEHFSELLPAHDHEAMLSWIDYANESERDSDYPREDFFQELYIEFSMAVRDHGKEVATTLFNISNTACINTFEIRYAAHLLADGATIAETLAAADAGKCQRTEDEYAEYLAAVNTLEGKEQGKTQESARPSIKDQLREGQKAADAQPPARPGAGSPKQEVDL